MNTGVLVVGAGPVGLSLAIDLARRGVDVCVVDELDEPTTESRAIVVHSRTLDHFQAFGVLDRIRERAIVSTGMEMHTGGRTVAAVEFDHIRATHPYSVSLVQSDTEEVLAQRLDELGVRVRRPATVTGIDQGTDDVAVTVREPYGDSVIRARYVVGADGARSAVRHLTGQRLAGEFVGDDVVLGDIDGDHEYERAHFHAFFSPGRTTGLLFPLRGRRLRVFAQLAPGTDPARAVDVEWLQQLLDERGMAVRVTDAHWLSRFELKHGQVPEYRRRRVFLAGDAAHIHSPAGALGMNTGIADAVNLGWKLARAGADDAEALLDSYHTERHPVGAHVVALTTGITRVATISNPIAQRIRNSVMHAGMELSPLIDRMAATIEQQTVHYRHSPVVTGRGRALHPGDFLYLPDTDVGHALGLTDGHLLITVGEPPGPAVPGYTPLPVSAADATRLLEQTGHRDRVALIVRPDGYVGAIGTAAADVTTGYARLIGCAAGS